MFEKSQTIGRFSGGRTRALNVHLGHVPYLEPERNDDKRGLRLAIVLAVLAHLAFFALQVPAGRQTPLRVGTPKPVYAIKPVRFEPPPPRAAEQLPQRKERKRIVPIPDPTPEEPEPIRVAEIEVPDVDLIGDSDLVFGIPDAAPGPGISGRAPLRMSGDITPPVKVHAPPPRYTEEGRQSRIQGVVILEAVIDERGQVGDVKVLKGLPMGLSESAVETVRDWRYRPATLDGQPVPVFFNLTVRFSLQ